ncbi:unnamed protein product [Adineta ricciae]|uniref:Uncharacterized protein n=1 Tax=Adineta ricciae TaxID=249248 RepID=A0A815JV79_ADIRI|nr:unnamed protein product [Adineta ricciae]CAF1382801.1 unnamed protein product [Adineta ricciae]
MEYVNDMWSHRPIDRASTPIPREDVNTQPRTSTPKISKTIHLVQRSRKKKKKKKSIDQINYHRLFYGNLRKHRHSSIQIWFL